MARVILSQYIALMEMYQAQLRAELNLLKDISEFEDFDEFKYQQDTAFRMLSKDIIDGILSRMSSETAEAFGHLAAAIGSISEKEGAKNED